jgi:hypothetical protein
VRAIQGAWSKLSALFSLKMRCVSFYFERSCPEQRPRAALKPQEPHSSGPWTPAVRAPPPRSSRVPRRGGVESSKK